MIARRIAIEAAKFIASLIAVVVMYQVAWHRGNVSGHMGVDYWCGWSDAMQQTDYGNKPWRGDEGEAKDDL